MKRGLALFVLGLVVGVAASLALSSVLPLGWRLAVGSVEGTVEAKQLDGERLLLTLSTSHGVSLATFEEEIAAIDLLVGPGDQITLAGRGYRPFLENPEIARVMRAPVTAPDLEEAASEEVEEAATGVEEPVAVEEETLPAEAEPESGETDPPDQVPDQEEGDVA